MKENYFNEVDFCIATCYTLSGVLMGVAGNYFGLQMNIPSAIFGAVLGSVGILATAKVHSKRNSDFQ